MATQVQIRRGTSSQVAAFTGAEGEIVVNTTNDSIHVNDGSTAGGFELARADLNNVSDTDLNAALTGNTVSALTVTTLTAGAFTSNGIDDNGTSTAITIDSSQNVLVGTTTHRNFSGGTTEITVGTATTGATAGGAITFDSGSGFLGYIAFQESEGTLGTLTSTPLVFTTGNTERMRIDSSGNVGILTSSPSSYYATQLVVNGGADGGITVVNTTTGDGRLMFADGTSGSDQYTGQIYYNHANNYMAFGTNGGTEAMRIDSSRNLLVGTTTPFGLLSVRDASGSSVSVTARFLGGASNDSLLIRGDGDAENTNNSYGAISDVRVKENIVDASPKLEDLMRVQVRNYNLIGRTQKQIGVVAQELEQVFPGMIKESPEIDTNGQETGETRKSVKYSVFVPMLIKAIQEQQETITALTARIEQLENN